MALVETVVNLVPKSLRGLALKHQEFLKFAAVGGMTFLVDTIIFYVLKLTILEPHPVTAKIVSVLIATIVSYVLNREWSFRTRGGRERPHEAALFFLVSGIGVILYAAPLWVSRYVLGFDEPAVSRLTEEIADFVSSSVIGTLLGMAFRWWAFRKFVFPDRDSKQSDTQLKPGVHD
ncbi:GtrA family protein [Actinoalloteichus hymeniacidonis]|uniref:Membrane protein n=1 Tax=Actinoalloteichus hymeniacidonis TaxID=340345 RepID=A0AAC9N0E1_9PSEU|nr:GtrA family protein [Actinoalloteichus hymeniacidonis]AOS65489.1 putative membrane protein [Actinoalloteichus hymeniacidonis]MBB5906424.1 putative flippase GtrA [Actinoalloteichus hymeniacidonis]